MGPCVKSMLPFLVLYCVSSVVESAKILLIPGPHYSHVNLFSTAGRALKDDGHNVYVLSVKKFQPNIEKHGLNPLIHISPLGQENDISARMEPYIKRLAKGDISVIDIFKVAFPTLSDYCKDMNRNDELMKEIKDIGFDLVINDATVFYVCMYMIPYRLGVKYMSLSALHDPWTFGVSGMPTVEPSQLLAYSNRMSFLQRVMNMVPFTFLAVNPISFLYSKEHMQEFAPEKPYKSFKQLVSESQMILINHDVTCTGYPRVSAPHYRYIGGSSATPPKPLPLDLKEFADGAKDGLIVLSFGSMEILQSLWKEMKPTIMKAFGQLHQRVIVQYGLDDVAGVPKNVKLVKWLPQNDLLGHPNTNVFITHGGNNGQLEAIFHGVPVLTMPISGDQQYNAVQAKTKGFGLILDRFRLTEEVIILKINEIINNKTYSENIKKCSQITQRLPSSQDTVVFWVNHVLRFGGDHFKSPALDMPMYQVLMLDIFAFFTLLLVTILVLVFSLCRCMFRLCRGSHKQKKE